MKLIIHIDGGSRGNPGPAGAGVVLQDGRDRPVLEAGYFLGQMTNNMAEYNALIKALAAAERASPTELLIYSDSELLVRQMTGQYRVKNANLMDLFDDAVARLRRLGTWKISHVRRESNVRADELANLAMDAGEDVIVLDRLEESPSRQRSQNASDSARRRPLSSTPAASVSAPTLDETTGNALAPICTACGVQFPPGKKPLAVCPICADERQLFPVNGQSWTSLSKLRSGHQNEVQEIEHDLTGFRTMPTFAIGQQALLVRTTDGNFLWDCISLLDGPTLSAIRELGGVSAIAISHPHFLGSVVDWSKALGGVPIYIHAADKEWVARPDSQMVFWNGVTHRIAEGLTLIHCGGHFAGACVLHWAAGADGRGTLLTSDIIHVIPDRTRVSFMYGFPTLIPLPAASVKRILSVIEPFEFNRIYGGWRDRAIMQDAKSIVRKSAERYILAINE